MRAPAACGGCREPSISAAVEKPEDQREPERFFGHRKAGQILPPQPLKRPISLRNRPFSAYFCLFCVSLSLGRGELGVKQNELIPSRVTQHWML